MTVASVASCGTAIAILTLALVLFRSDTVEDVQPSFAGISSFASSVGLDIMLATEGSKRPEQESREFDSLFEELHWQFPDNTQLLQRVA